jgi:5-hydroxyisourate hydrolase
MIARGCLHCPLQQAGTTHMRIFTRVLDSTYGKSAVGVHACLAHAADDGWTALADAETNNDGRLEEWENRHLERGLYRIVFDSDSYFASLGAVAAYPEVVVIFRMPNEAPIFQVQVTLAPYSYSTYFGIRDV